MIANVDNVIKWLEINKLDYWQVQLKDADNSNVFESDDAGFASNAKRFRDVMELCAGSRFFIKASEKKGINRGKFYEEFKNVADQHQSTQSQQSPLIAGVPQDEVQKQIETAIAGFKNTLKMEALEAENKELKQAVRDHDNMTTRVLGKIEPYLGTLISTVASKFLPQTAPVSLAGIERIETDEEPETTNTEPETQNAEHGTQNAERETQNTEQKRLILALEKWEKADPDFLSLIEAVATLADTKDPMYTMAKNMLKNK